MNRKQGSLTQVDGNTLSDFSRSVSRRWFMRDCGMGLGGIAMNHLMQDDAHAETAANLLAPKQPPFPAKAKRVIFLFMHGGPSQVDT